MAELKACCGILLLQNIEGSETDEKIAYKQYTSRAEEDKTLRLDRSVILDLDSDSTHRPMAQCISEQVSSSDSVPRRQIADTYVFSDCISTDYKGNVSIDNCQLPDARIDGRKECRDRPRRLDGHYASLCVPRFHRAIAPR